MTSIATLALRLAGPLQAWGGGSQFNRRHTADRPTKSGVIGLLAAAQGLRRGEDLTHLLGLQLGIRVDQPGSVLCDFHTASNLHGGPLPSAKVNTKGVQKATSPAKPTYVTQRYYLQDAVFLAAVCGPEEVIVGLRDCLRRPAFPLALGRRSCPPSQPLIVAHADCDLWSINAAQALQEIPWQAGYTARRKAQFGKVESVDLSTTVDSEDGHDVEADVPSTFDQRGRAFSHRRVQHGWVTIPTGVSIESDMAESRVASTGNHDPLLILGGE